MPERIAVKAVAVNPFPCGGSGSAASENGVSAAEPLSIGPNATMTVASAAEDDNVALLARPNGEELACRPDLDAVSRVPRAELAGGECRSARTLLTRSRVK